MSCLVAEFDSDVRLVQAAAHLHALGYGRRADGAGRMEAYSPIAIPGIDVYLSRPRSRLPVWVFIAACLGCLIAYLIQWGSVLDYPLRVAGFPTQSLPAFIPIMFETTILAGAVTAFVAVFVRSGLLQWWHPLEDLEGFDRSVIDRFFLTVDTQESAQFSVHACRVDLSGCRALRVVVLGEQP